MTSQWHSTEPEDPRPGHPGAPHIRWVRVSYDRWRTSPSWIQRILAGFVLLILLGLAVLLLIGGLVVGAIVAGVLAILMGIAWIAQRIRSALDGRPARSSGGNFQRERENVRVIGPTQHR